MQKWTDYQSDCLMSRTRYMFIELHSRNLQHRKNTIICSFQKNEPSKCLQNLDLFAKFWKDPSSKWNNSCTQRNVRSWPNVCAACDRCLDRISGVRRAGRILLTTNALKIPTSEKYQTTQSLRICGETIWEMERDFNKYIQLKNCTQYHMVREICDRTLDGLVLGRSVGT